MGQSIEAGHMLLEAGGDRGPAAPHAIKPSIIAFLARLDARAVTWQERLVILS